MMFTCDSTLGRPLRAGARHRPIDTHSGAGKSHQAYLWSCCIGTDDRTQAVIYDFAESRAGKHALAFLGDWLSPSPYTQLSSLYASCQTTKEAG
ncbi:MAG: transposase [Proteobacteria bacterium]|nr:transposase [Pseudomonadota bacterium]